MPFLHLKRALTAGWSIRCWPTPGNSCLTGMETDLRCSAGPIPERRRIYTHPKVSLGGSVSVFDVPVGYERLRLLLWCELNELSSKDDKMSQQLTTKQLHS